MFVWGGSKTVPGNSAPGFIILKSNQALNLTQLHIRLPVYLVDPQVQCVVDRFLRMVIMLAHLHANAHKYVVGYSRCVNKMVSMET